MNNKLKNKKIAIYIALFIILLGGSFIIYKITKASTTSAEYDYIKLTNITTGTNFDESDGLDYSASDSISYSSIEGYNPSYDANGTNRLVKSFDTIKYDFSYLLKDGDRPEGQLDGVSVTVKVTLNNDDKNYVSFDKESLPGEESKIYTFNDRDTYDSFNDSIILYVNNAPNGYKINPSFEFKIDGNDNYNGVTLGLNSECPNDSDSAYPNCYQYENDNYKTRVKGPTNWSGNYMPTVVSSKPGNLIYDLIPASNDQVGNLDAQTNGRYMTYLLGIRLSNPDGEARGYQGLTYPTDGINFNVMFSQDGQAPATSKTEWIRYYTSNATAGANPVSSYLPYSTKDINDLNKEVRYPGTISVTSSSDSTFAVSLTGYNLVHAQPTLGAAGNNLSSNSPYIATVALTNFSQRVKADGRNAVINSVTVGDMNTTPGDPVSASLLNDYYERAPYYNLSAKFYDENENKTVTSVSRGTKVIYNNEFYYQKTDSDQGLKVVSKFDTNAFRVVPYKDEANDITKQVSVEIKCGENFKEDCEGISQDDFEIKYVTGSFDAGNYVMQDTYSLPLGEENKALAAEMCSYLDLGYYDVNQIQNLYGGPCIKDANDLSNISYNSIYDAVYETDEIGSDDQPIKAEIPISKVIVQTKNGVNLPDNCKVNIKVGVRVRDVSDLTQTYQATTVASTSDYDSELYYYTPNVEGMTNPDNYLKTIYNQSDVIRESSAPYGSSLKIVDFTLRQNMTVTNTNQDGSLKTTYRTTDNDTITYKVDTFIEDNNIKVGADDSWYIKSVTIAVMIPNSLVYIQDDSLIQPYRVDTDSENTTLFYSLPYTKPNMDLASIYFRTKLNPRLHGETNAITVKSIGYAVNIDGDRDTSRITDTMASFVIYGTGVNEVIAEQKIGSAGSVVDKDTPFSYILKAYNNTGETADYSFIDILPYNGDGDTGAIRAGEGSKFSGNYKIKVNSTSEEAPRIKCSTTNPKTINPYVDDSENDDNNVWIECSTLETDEEGYIDGVTAIRVENIIIPEGQYMPEIELFVKPTGNKFADVYSNNFFGKTATTRENYSNKVKINVINRTISGRVFFDNSLTGVKDGTETYVKDQAVTLYKVDRNSLVNVGETTTDENGYYKFDKLEKGVYRIRSKYNSELYDLSLRYATEDRAKDSDAYKIDNKGSVEIVDKSPDSTGIILRKDTRETKNMDIGLIVKQSFGFTLKKYIYRTEITNNNGFIANDYNNLSKVAITTLPNPGNSAIKAYYGIDITNNSTKAGYVNLLADTIPNGLAFDASLEENAGWFQVGDSIQTTALENVLIKPGETQHLKLSLYTPTAIYNSLYLNKASIIQMTEYQPEELTDDKTYVNNDRYNIGDSINYAGVSWHVVGETTMPDNSQELTLLADSGTISSKKSHGNAPYKWSSSNINAYINGPWINSTSLYNGNIMDRNICDDASGLPETTFGGGVLENGSSCLSGIYYPYKIRLLTKSEYENAKAYVTSHSTDYTWLTGSDNFWLMSAVDTTIMHDVYGYPTSATNGGVDYGIYGDYAYYADHGTVMPISSNTSMEVRPVITVSTYNIITE